MTITHKPGQHPDADQLSAFVEQVLPAHERETVLAHLAVCAECRGVVALALPEDAAAVAAARAQERHSWFQGWMVFMPAAAAVAALAMFVFFVHTRGPAAHEQAGNAPAATVQPQAGIQPQQAKSAPAEKAQGAPASPPAPAAMAVRAPAASGGPVPKVAATEQGEASRGSLGAASGLSSAGLQEAKAEQKVVPAAPAMSAVSSFAPSDNAALHGEIEPRQQNALKQSQDQRSQDRNAAVGGPLQNNTVLPLQANAQNGQQQNLPRPAAPETVQVEAETAPIATERAEARPFVAAGNRQELRLQMQPLPSGLPAVSTAARGPIVLAIDAHHGVFISRDAGEHWQPVRAVWKGHAVRVDAAAPVGTLIQPAVGLVGPGAGAYQAPTQGVGGAKTARATLTGTVTDQAGAAISRATVTITDPRTQHATTLTTDAEGRYAAAGLTPGNFDVTASAPGFRRRDLTDVAVNGTTENRLNLTLAVGEASESVTVATTQDEIETDKPLFKAKKRRAPLFEMTTDSGARWASDDGVKWRRE